MNHSFKHILIVGGGIGGLTAAIALRQAGCEVDLLEQRAVWTQPGVGIIQPNNALRALATLDLSADCLRNGYAYARYDYQDATGRSLPGFEGPPLDGGLPPYNGILRSRLHDILLRAATRAGARLHLGRTWTDIAPADDGVDVVFTDGASARYDLIVGADGIYSPLRARFFGPQYRARPTGQSVWRVTMPRPADVTHGVMLTASHSKAGYIPLTDELMYLLLVTEEDPGLQFPAERLHDMLLSRLEGFGGLVERTRQFITPESDIVYRPLEVVFLPQPWYRHRILLIGDAAHASTPHLGQGAAMAVEDAVVLADLLRSAATPAELGAAFMQRRYARASHIQQASFLIGEYELGHRPDLNLATLLKEARERAAATA